MNKQTVALIASFAGWILTADVADATTYEAIAGQWCGDVTDYVFTPNTLTVKFHDNRPANEFKITKYTYTNNSVRIDWLNGAKWARETQTDEVRASYLQLAQIWLDTASKLAGLPPSRTPPAPDNTTETTRSAGKGRFG